MKLKTHLLLVCAIYVFGFHSTIQAQSPTKIGNETLLPVTLGITISSNAPVRDAPFKSAHIFTKLRKGETVAVGSLCNGYYGINLRREKAGKWVPAWAIKKLTVDETDHILHLPVSSQSSKPTVALPSVPSASDPGPRVSLADTENNWYKVRDCSGYFRFHNAAVVNGDFTAEIRLLNGYFKQTSKPIQCNFSVTIFSISGKILAQDKASIDAVSAEGGTFILSGPAVVSDQQDEPTYCSIAFQSGWVYRKVR